MIQSVLSLIINQPELNLCEVASKIGIDAELIKFISERNIEDSINLVGQLRDLLLLYKSKTSLLRRANKKNVVEYLSNEDALRCLTMYEGVSVSRPVKSKDKAYSEFKLSLGASESEIGGDVHHYSSDVYKIQYRPNDSPVDSVPKQVFLSTPCDDNISEYSSILNEISSNVRYRPVSSKTSSVIRVVRLFDHFQMNPKYESYRDFLLNYDVLKTSLNELDSEKRRDLDDCKIGWNTNSLFFKNIMYPLSFFFRR
jgi:hypothetical protein